MFAFRQFRFLGLLCIVLLCHTAYAMPYAGQTISTYDSTLAQSMATTQFDSIMRQHPMLSNKNIINAIERPHIFQNKTIDFYMLMLLCIILGIVRYTNTSYFTNLWRVFRNPGYARAAKEQLEIAVVPNMLMNFLFALVAGIYIYYLVRINTPLRTEQISPFLLIVMLVAGMCAIYLAKYVVVWFSGWAFRMESISESYIFNIFLINKIIAIALLPFVLIMAFADPVLASPAIIVSALVVGFLFLNRYVRSWQVFGSFFQYSKFHFFTYLCASEILPLAVLMKLLVRGLIY